ncbi:hypothetical protein K2173_010606 [Erythroxylum novogranatense]|uniref:BZIP transcription factor n=1 Tax=Erythroxylum novogranatense TaxID=1862640 RepID=A0AAV8TGF5_9ROSI|nr:hypothetical protein K2173_010606 [Erythroxylum novogranatense]
MGCAKSKLDDLPAVALCRERCGFLEEAIQQRFALAEAHLAYVHSLKRIGNSLHSFIQQDCSSSGGAPLSPHLNLPPQRKGDPIVFFSDQALQKPHHSHSNSADSHLHFHSEGDEDHDSDSDSDDPISHLHHSGHSSPLHHHSGGDEYMSYMSSDHQAGFAGGGLLHMNYMKKQAAPPSVFYEQRPAYETVYFSESSASPSYFYNNNNNTQPSNQYGAMGNSSSYPYFGYPNYGAGRGGGAMTGYNGSSSPQRSVASSSKPPPPPPPPPSGWDFLNPFESYDKYYASNTPSRDSKDVREEEGIPDLEDEDYQHEVVKEVDGSNRNYSKSVMIDDEGHRGATSSSAEAEASLYETRPSVSMENDGAAYEMHVGGKKVIDNERSEERTGGGGFKGRAGHSSLDIAQVALEIKVQFERASESGNEIAKMLEAGQLHYEHKHVSKMLQGGTPSLSVVSSGSPTSKSSEALAPTNQPGPSYFDVDEDIKIRSKNLSSILQKLYLWEKKLYNEVKAEEKMRLHHERKLRKLKRLDERGAEAHKVDATRTIIRDLSTKIRIAIQVVDKISITINKIRDEELWPQLNELIQGLSRMWKSMLECHHNQRQLIMEARSFGPIGSGKKMSDDHLQATLQLVHELLHWTSSFTSWVDAQKGYIRVLNNWLFKCLLYEPEVTADGIVPFSPGRLGAPPVFVICNQWAQALERISEKEVIDAMRVFAMSVFQLWEQDKLEMQQGMIMNKGLEGKVKNLDREDQKIQKEIQALDKKIVLVVGDGNSLSLTGNVVYQSDTSTSNLKDSLQRIFEAMEKFTTVSMKVYEELMQRGEEERFAQEHDRVS